MATGRDSREHHPLRSKRVVQTAACSCHFCSFKALPSHETIHSARKGLRRRRPSWWAHYFRDRHAISRHSFNFKKTETARRQRSSGCSHGPACTGHSPTSSRSRYCASRGPSMALLTFPFLCGLVRGCSVVRGCHVKSWGWALLFRCSCKMCRHWRNGEEARAGAKA